MNKEAKTEKDWRTEKRKTGGSIKTVKGKLYARIQYTDEQSGKRKEKLRPATIRTHARALPVLWLSRCGENWNKADKPRFVQINYLFWKLPKNTKK